MTDLESEEWTHAALVIGMTGDNVTFETLLKLSQAADMLNAVPELHDEVSFHPALLDAGDLTRLEPSLWEIAARVVGDINAPRIALIVCVPEELVDVPISETLRELGATKIVLPESIVNGSLSSTDLTFELRELANGALMAVASGSGERRSVFQSVLTSREPAEGHPLPWSGAGSHGAQSDFLMPMMEGAEAPRPIPPAVQKMVRSAVDDLFDSRLGSDAQPREEESPRGAYTAQPEMVRTNDWGEAGGAGRQRPAFPPVLGSRATGGGLLPGPAPGSQVAPSEDGAPITRQRAGGWQWGAPPAWTEEQGVGDHLDSWGERRTHVDGRVRDRVLPAAQTMVQGISDRVDSWREQRALRRAKELMDIRAIDEVGTRDGGHDILYLVQAASPDLSRDVLGTQASALTLLKQELGDHWLTVVVKAEETVNRVAGPAPFGASYRQARGADHGNRFDLGATCSALVELIRLDAAALARRGHPVEKPIVMFFATEPPIVDSSGGQAYRNLLDASSSVVWMIIREDKWLRIPDEFQVPGSFVFEAKKDGVARFVTEVLDPPPATTDGLADNSGESE